ncbi:MAG: cysteine--tRNA ligase [Eggerthellaceae bacterium]|jgi:cysteinyl-tRNA synthetase|nr:cysteine--tRNA ligase [Eggerthellaceae bacterium]MDR2721315.1 cysteine--tRNA ligase [Coriobacteriaceae bacterium]
MIRIYDTKQRKKVDFEAVEKGKVGIYVCGPTVYNYIHIGNARTFISFDIIRRYFAWRGFEVTFVQNITDVDDKIIAKAEEEGCSAAEVAQDYTQAFIADMHAAGVGDPDIRPKATEEIESMVALIQELIDAGHAYEVSGDVYFAVRSFDEYGQLSGRNVDEMESGHRELRAQDCGIDARKCDPLDFAVWKAAKPGEPSWESPWGQGRPGWHIECSAMSRKYLGLPFDIHGGGADLVFPHHENERAQSEAVGEGTFARYWMHGGMLQVNAEKMSKSLGNFKLLRDVLEVTDSLVLRMLMLQTHYRSPLDFSDERLSEAETALGRMVNALTNLEWVMKNAAENADADAGVLPPLDKILVEEQTRELYRAFVVAMDDDINTAEALGVIFGFVGNLNTWLAGAHVTQGDVAILANTRRVLLELMGVFGIDLADKIAQDSSSNLPDEVLILAQDIAGFDGQDKSEAVKALLACRETARATKDWAAADSVRDGLLALGLKIEDTPQGTRVL